MENMSSNKYIKKELEIEKIKCHIYYKENNDSI